MEMKEKIIHAVKVIITKELEQKGDVRLERLELEADAIERQSLWPGNDDSLPQKRGAAQLVIGIVQRDLEEQVVGLVVPVKLHSPHDVDRVDHLLSPELRPRARLSLLARPRMHRGVPQLVAVGVQSPRLRGGGVPLGLQRASQLSGEVSEVRECRGIHRLGVLILIRVFLC